MGYSTCTTCASKPQSADKWRYTLITSVLFLIVEVTSRKEINTDNAIMNFILNID